MCVRVHTRVSRCEHTHERVCLCECARTLATDSLEPGRAEGGGSGWAGGRQVGLTEREGERASAPVHTSSLHLSLVHAPTPAQRTQPVEPQSPPAGETAFSRGQPPTPLFHRRCPGPAFPAQRQPRTLWRRPRARREGTPHGACVTHTQAQTGGEPAAKNTRGGRGGWLSQVTQAHLSAQVTVPPGGNPTLPVWSFSATPSTPLRTTPPLQHTHTQGQVHTAVKPRGGPDLAWGLPAQSSGFPLACYSHCSMMPKAPALEHHPVP